MTNATRDQTDLATSKFSSPKRFGKLLRWGIWATPLLLLVTLFGWSLASPVGSSPDDDFHVASIWCAYGERANLCEPAEAIDQRKVPLPIVNMTCFAFHSEIDGSCQKGLPEELSERVHPVDHGNWNGQTYPPLFYATMGIFASENVAVSVVTMRLFNSVLATLALTLTMIALPRRLRPVLGFSTVIAMIPLGIFTLASTNPSSWALLSAAMVFPAVLGIAETRGRQRIALVAIAVVGAVLGAGARADAGAYAALAALLAWFIAGRRSLWNTLAALAVCIIGAVSFLTSGQSDGLSGLGTEDGAGHASINLVIHNLLQLPELWIGMFTNLGWLDTPISPIAIFGVIFSAIGVIFAGLGRINWRKGLSMIAATGALVLLPLYVLYGSNAGVGSQVQPRYILPLFVLLLAVALAPVPTSVSFSLPQIVVLAVLLVCGHAIALYDTMTRYIAGERIVNLDSGSWWWGGSPVSPLATLFISVVAASLLIGMLAWKFAVTRLEVDYPADTASTVKLAGAAH